MWQGLKAFAVAFLTTLIATPLVIRLALKMGWVDKPLPRRINKYPVPTLGGLAIFVGFLAASVLSWPVANFRHLPSLYLSGALFFLLGAIDDIYDLSAKLKFWVMLGISVLYVLTGPRIQHLTNPSGGTIDLGILAIPLSVMWLVGTANLVNLIDGLDGLATGTVAITALTCIFLSSQKLDWFILVLNCGLLGACLGFLPYNFNPAKVFMGDSGALFLGFVVGALAIEGSLKGAATVTLAVPLLALGLPILDTIFSIFRRAKTKKPIYQADGDHLHHRMLHLGLGQKKVVLILYLVNVLFAIGAFLVFNVSPEIGFIYTLIVVCVITIKAARQGVLKVGKKDQDSDSVRDKTGSNQSSQSYQDAESGS
ncbi:MAG: glycosyltransferase family 4 protein [Bacillota bacterium]|jgi:UDP-GlcNAc:undecaprenyl-phosphate GlcNAc-1-phosphate transferase|nr:undecaprenyl/decaprenyl-phosphate alpha-N-acetylglucosaminyl 1-phosphate transferase [Bacillota bacterium]HOA90242.1 MraY family glycosyltransferase [Bacillota bacterium]HOJ46411.1 MraY family glycosyltransferase [Bacillota bacterium]HOL13157.1 MraY family glycosyltransferase [Bacillota bacterium]HOP53370.1 MraY family glycosyltransferase [Bacillota bacterium]